MSASPSLPRPAARGWLFSLLLVFTTAAHAADVHVPLPAVIADDGAERFAVSVPVDLGRDAGDLRVEGAQATWTLAIVSTGALGLGLHADRWHVPAGSSVRWTSAEASAEISAHDLDRGELWLPTIAGERAVLEVRFAATALPQFEVHVDSVQPAFRAPDAADSLAKATSACAVNYACNRNAARDLISRGTVRVRVENQISCTGTLVNNARNDGRPFVLSAGHCRLSPASAGSVQVLWNQVVPCGQALVNSQAPPSQLGAFERAFWSQQDGWLIELDEPPAYADAYWVGLDVADPLALAGSYSIHHQAAMSQQLAQYALPARKITTQSGLQAYRFDGGISLGDIGEGASGTALIGAQNLLVGVYQGSAGTECAKTSLTYQRLSVFWNGSGAPGTAARPWLDPDNSGQTVIAGIAEPGTPAPQPGLLSLTLNSVASLVAGNSATISWLALGATSCVASGDWSGVKPLTGSEATPPLETPGVRNYVLTCNGLLGDIVRSVQVNVLAAAPDQPPASTADAESGGGGSLGAGLLLVLLTLLAARYAFRSATAAPARRAGADNRARRRPPCR